MSGPGFEHAPVHVLPPFILFGHLILALLLGGLVHLPVPLPFFMHVFGIIIVLPGLYLALGAIQGMRSAGTPVDPYQPVTAMVTSGPYRLSRNPIYASFVCALAGLPLALGTYWGVLLSPLMVALMTGLVIRPEETYLEKKFGREYLTYRSHVRRWL